MKFVTKAEVMYYVLVITLSQFITRGCEAPEGDKLAKRPRGHVITNLLQYDRERRALEFLRRRISLSNERNRRYYRHQQMLSLWK